MNLSGQPPEKDFQKEANQPLSESEFAENNSLVKAIPLWIWLFLFTILIVLFIGLKAWYGQIIGKEEGKEPFMKVTNREMSVFLWQFPAYIRANTSKKTGYMPGFFFDKENFDPKKEEEFVSAPPDLLFLYHTWNRLLAPYFISRPIKPAEFNEFLTQLPEWKPENWKLAPDEYTQLVTLKEYSKLENMENLSNQQLPLIVRQAFLGWKNYFKEGPFINKLAPSVGQVQNFLEKYPTYGRPSWRNIGLVAGKEVAGLKYLQELINDSADSQEIITPDELSSFLKVALFNFEHFEKGV